MSGNSNSRRKSEKSSYYQSSSHKNSSGRSAHGPSRPNRFQTSRKPQRPVIKYDPSMFMKKVEEQVTAQAYVPEHMFSDFAIEPQLKANIVAKGYKNPTPIQDKAIPVLLEGKDVIATANTGTGKTAAFLIPLINNVLTKKTSRILIIAPTRELSDQIHEELLSFKANMRISSVLCIGGLNMNAQIRDLKNNPTFVIGTPGRLIDLEQNRIINFANYTSIVLDEVDRMLDMGFIKDMHYIIRKLPAKRHSLFFSATLPTTLKGVMDGFLNNPVSISVKSRQSAENVNQDIVKIGGRIKIDVLHDLFIKPEFKKVIVFVRTKRAADKLTRSLIDRGFKAAVIHGDKSQAQRNRALDQFKDDIIKVLVATDVVARGIDIDDVSHVINFDLPQTYEDYIHRIGRTGRADKIGQALTFID